MRCHQLGDARRLMPGVCLHRRRGFHRPLWYLTRPGDAFNGKNGALKMEGEGNMNGCRRNESWNEEIWSGGHLRSSRRANFCDMDEESVEERTISFFFLSFFLFFLDTCPILNFFQENSSVLGNF